MAQHLSRQNVEWIVIAPLQRLNLSRNASFRSLEVRAILGYSRALKELLLTITSPVFFEIIVVFSEVEARYPPRGLAKMLREMYEIRGFRVTFCLETREAITVPNLRALTSAKQVEVGKGAYDFLPSALGFSSYSNKLQCAVGSFHGWKPVTHPPEKSTADFDTFSTLTSGFSWIAYILMCF
jgi:hypothetical protein